MFNKCFTFKTIHQVFTFDIPQFAIRPELKLEKLVAELALVPDVVAEVEIVRHTQSGL